MGRSKDILKQAHQFFAIEAYDKAIFLYAQLLSLDTTNIEYRLYTIFCDIGYENSQKAQNLYDYFTVAKTSDFDGAVKYVQDLISAYDGDNEKLMNVLKEISMSNVETLNAIDYNEFMALVENRGSFKEAYQDIMFSTKVAITTKDDLVDFIDKLIENDFNSTAYNYLDGFNQYFSYDENLTKLYNKLAQNEKLTNRDRQVDNNI